MAKIKVLSTKKLEPSLIRKAEEQGIDVVEQEAIQVKPILNRETADRIISLALDNKRTIVLTSSNAVNALEKYMSYGGNFCLIDWQVFCLSGKTKDTLLSAHRLEKQILGEAPNATELAHEIIRQNVSEVVFFCGNRRRDELPDMLQAAGITVHEVVVYEVEETPVAAAGDYEAVLFFSPSAVQSFFAANQLKENTVCFAIGQTTANSVKQFTQSKPVVSKEPTQEALLMEVINYFKNEVNDQH